MFILNTYKWKEAITFKEKISDVLNGIKILLAEDNATNRMVVRKFLTLWSVIFTEACNGKEAVEKFGAAEFDLILMI
jgi:PleD family two-component response regulator